jgi:hypothetical protein
MGAGWHYRGWAKSGEDDGREDKLEDIVIAGRPAVFISCSERFRERVADPLKATLESLGLKAVISTERPRLPGRSWEPEAKVDSLMQSTKAFVALVTPDEKLSDGQSRSRPNITDEIARARSSPHLEGVMIIAKSPDVDLWGNISPTYERLDIDNPQPMIDAVVEQLRAFGLLPPGPSEPARATSAQLGDLLAPVRDLIEALALGDHDEAQRRIYKRFRGLRREAQRQLITDLVRLAQGNSDATSDNGMTLVALTSWLADRPPLRQLSGNARVDAERYVRRTPPQVRTVIRRGLEGELGWTPAEE